jgi:hypothetical protein
VSSNVKSKRFKLISKDLTRLPTKRWIFSLSTSCLLCGELLAAVVAEEELCPRPLGGPVADLVVQGEPLYLDDLLVGHLEVVLHLLMKQ